MLFRFPGRRRNRQSYRRDNTPVEPTPRAQGVAPGSWGDPADPNPPAWSGRVADARSDVAGEWRSMVKLHALPQPRNNAPHPVTVQCARPVNLPAWMTQPTVANPQVGRFGWLTPAQQWRANGGRW